MKANWLLLAGLGALTCGLLPSANAQQKPSEATVGGKAETSQQTPPVIEAQALSLLQKNQQVMFALKTYAAECHTIKTRDKPTGKLKTQFQFATLAAEKPNKMRYDGWNLNDDPAANGWTKPASAPTYTFACDGKDCYKQFDKMYRKDARIQPESLHTILEPWEGFYAPTASVYDTAQRYRKKNELREARLAGRDMVDGVLCDKIVVVIASSYNGQRYDSQATWYFGPDGLTRRCVDHVSFDAKPGSTRDATLSNIRLNEPIEAALYAYAPPKGVTPEAEEKQAPLLANGTTAPDFTAYEINKKPLKLSDLRGKVVVIDFWASWCPPCNAAMPHNQAVMKKLKAEGLPVVMLAVDDGEPRAAFDTWVKQKRASLSALTFAYVPQTENLSGSRFKVTGIPTQYVLDKNGVVRASFVGFDGTNNELETAIRAALGTGKTVKVAAAAKK